MAIRVRTLMNVSIYLFILLEVKFSKISPSFCLLILSNNESGFFGPGDVCDDIIECALNPGICPTGALCTNTIGSFICSCETGYHVISDACVDINECLDGQGNWFKLVKTGSF